MKNSLEYILKTINYDEVKVPEYKLPSALIAQDGKVVDSEDEWINYQRQYILRLFEKNVYGKLPPCPDNIKFEVLNIKKDALDNTVTRKEIRIHLLMNSGKKDYLDLLLYIPNNAKVTPPVFLGLNFRGNHSVSNENDILLPQKWIRPLPEVGLINGKVSEESRGHASFRWPLKLILDRGYALATLHYGDIYPDYPEGIKSSIYNLFENMPKETGSISAWAWGLSRAMDYLETEQEIDHHQVAVIGHSRLGKTALWAGVQDHRFAMIVSNNSGSGGAAISRRRFGETIECFPAQNVGYWFISEFYKYSHYESTLPVDQHMLLSLFAPKPVYIASATEDLWADPHGEFLSAVHASPVYNLFGSTGLGTDKMPKPNQSIQNDIGYHIRKGKHDITAMDWNFYLDFADKHFFTNTYIGGG